MAVAARCLCACDRVRDAFKKTWLLSPTIFGLLSPCDIWLIRGASSSCFATSILAFCNLPQLCCNFQRCLGYLPRNFAVRSALGRGQYFAYCACKACTR